MTDSSTDSIEIASLRESGPGRTQAFQATMTHREALRPKTDVEANVILIAHPENRMLGTRFRLRPDSVIEIGRSPAAEISLPEVLSISRTHARLEHRGSEVVLQDLGSTNGTYINDRVIQGENTLSSGDRFQVGAVHFKFLHEKDVENAYHLAIYNLVMRDGLTEIFNKRKFQEEIDREVIRAGRYARPLSLILFDIDRFKGVNDNYGHLCGDYILKRVTEKVSDLLRSEQVFARVGGEEFVALLPETTGENGFQLAEKLREVVAEKPFQYAGLEVAVTSSFGVSELGEVFETPQALYEAADRALYHSKQNGRNLVTCYDPDAHGAIVGHGAIDP